MLPVVLARYSVCCRDPWPCSVCGIALQLLLTVSFQAVGAQRIFSSWEPGARSCLELQLFHPTLVEDVDL